MPAYSVLRHTDRCYVLGSKTWPIVDFCRVSSFEQATWLRTINYPKDVFYEE